MSKPIDIQVQVNKKKEVNIEVNSTYSGKVPLNGFPGQVLSKTNRGYKWEDNPLSVNTWNDLPEEPSTHAIYLVKDVNKLVRWDKPTSQWYIFNQDLPDLGELAFKDDGYVEVTTFDNININDYTPTGSVSTPSITVTTDTDTIQPIDTLGTPTTLDLTKFDGGEEATWTGYSYTAPTLGQPTTNSFAVSGVNVAMNNGTLTITDALTSNAVTQQGEFTSGDVNFGVFNGGKSAKLNNGFYTEGTSPTLGDSKTFVSGVTASLDEAPVFTGDAQSIDYEVTTSQKTIDVIFTEND